MIMRQDCLFSYDELMEISPKTKLMMILDEIDVSPVSFARYFRIILYKICIAVFQYGIIKIIINSQEKGRKC